MYQFLKGIIIEKITEPQGSEKIILDVSGIGFEIYTTLSSINLAGEKGQATKVFTALIHKEDQMTLFGFPTLLERELFNLLCSVSGIGPKTALSLLNNLTVSEISHSVLNENISALRKANGIGEKTASRIILELKEKIKNWKYLPIIHSESGENIGGQRSGVGVLNEARSVLQSLGYSNQEINQAISQLSTQLKDSESIVHSALKLLAGVKR
ncbi:MAG: Holliday junction branch migration protein RuvA [Candidatus Melainabacteria bacterium]|nr:Holliday junction branch migration protein RuvA [Candidatus Melainabacteria bacterium]